MQYKLPIIIVVVMGLNEILKVKCMAQGPKYRSYDFIITSQNRLVSRRSRQLGPNPSSVAQ